MKSATKKWSTLGVVACLSMSLVACQDTQVDAPKMRTTKEMTQMEKNVKISEVKVTSRSESEEFVTGEDIYVVANEEGDLFTAIFSKKQLASDFPSKDLTGKSLEIKTPTEWDARKGAVVLDFKPLTKTIVPGRYLGHQNVVTAMEMYRSKHTTYNGWGLLDTHPSDKVLTARVLELKDTDGTLQKYALVNVKELMKSDILRKLPSFMGDYDTLSESKKDVAFAVQVDKKTKVGENVSLSKNVQGLGYAFVQKGKVAFKVE